MQDPTQNSNPKQPTQKLRTWPLMLIALSGLIAAISLVLLVPQYLKTPLDQLQTSLLQNSSTSESPTTEQNSLSFDTPPSTAIIPSPSQSASSSASSTPLYKVTRVVDGDTIVVNINGQEEKLRLIGVDTPESVDPRRPVECFGLEASNYTKSLLENQNILLESDPTQGDKDKYGRLLRYILLPNPAAPRTTTNINLQLIQEGYAHEYTYRLPYKYQSEFKLAQTQAENAQKGLWSPTACGSP